MSVHQNFLLARIKAAGIESFLPRLSVVTLGLETTFFSKASYFAVLVRF